jgi:predicted phosphoadenosine phosphosulfate sulfurtransferase
MKIYYNDDVVTAGLKRTRFIYEHFGRKTFVAFSGGKDSTVCLELAHMVAREMDLLPVNVMWLDQEAEWDSTVEYCREVFHRDWVKPYWIQAPFILDNSLNASDGGLHCWYGVNDMREREPDSIHEIQGSEKLYFVEMLDKIAKTFFPGGCSIYGMRCDESPSRRKNLLNVKAFVGPEVWGSIGKGNRRAGVIYDWTTEDVWGFICKYKVKYNSLYDTQFQNGVGKNNMRVSSLVHETALHALDYAQEFEHGMWEKLVGRIDGINTYNQCREAYQCPDALPSAFKNWPEYRNYLLDALVKDPEHKKIMAKAFAASDKKLAFLDKEIAECVYRVHVNVVLKDDYCLTQLKNNNAIMQGYYSAIKRITGGLS